VRRLVTGSLASLVFTGTFLVLPVYAQPGPEPEPVAASSDEVPMGSVDAPAADADVQEGLTDPVTGIAETQPVLTVTRTDVDRFSLVGVTWAHDPAVTDTLVQVRVQDETGAWGGWTEVGVETAEVAEPGADVRGGTEPLWTGPSTGVEVELVTRSGAAPTDVQLDLVDPGSSPADSALGTPDIQDTADAAMDMPDVYSRAQWGADERIRTWNPTFAPTLKAATIHHTAGSNAYTAGQVAGIIRSIYEYHAVKLGWGDIGYHVIVDKYGRMWEGRYGGLSSTVVGAHSGGFNTSTFGVSMLGNYDVVDTTPAMIQSVSAIIAWKFALYGVDPAGTTTLTSSGGGTSRFAAGRQVALPTVFAHREVGSTACPGRYGFARMGEIRAGVSDRMRGVSDGIAERYAADQGLRTTLGAPVGSPRIEDGVRWQQYAHGRMYWSPSTGVHALWGDILARYLALGGPRVLGAPTSDHLPTPSGTGYYATFQVGSIYWTLGVGPRWVKGWVLDRYGALNREAGLLGYPTSEELPAAGGVYQQFQGGVVYSSASTGAHAVWGAVLDKWTAMGREKGILGFPTSDEVRTRNGAYGSFQRGGVFASSAGAFEMHGWIWDRWVAAGAGSAAVGFPTSDERRAPDGRGAFNTFSNGVVYSSAATGAHEVVGAVAQKWLALGGPGSFLGYPVAAPKALTGKGTVSRFQHGWIYASPGTGAHPVHGWIGALWQSMGYERSALGYPTSGEQRAPDGVGVFQTFTGGVVYSSPRGGARAVQGPIEDKWTRLGGLSSWIGPPVTNQLTMPDGRGRASVFASGAAIYWSPGTGAFEVHGWIRDLYSSLGAERSFLGYPTSDETPVAGTPAVVATFQGGRIYSSPRTGAREVHGLILGRYLQLGGPTSALGLPTSNEYGVRDGRRSDFQHGSITFNSRTGALTVTTR
jgi:uncharacterized protein with LGFP repeats